MYLELPLDKEHKLNVHKTFRKRPGRLLNVLRTFTLRPVFRRLGQLSLTGIFFKIGKSCQPLFFPNGPPQMFDDHAFSSEYDNLVYNNLFKVSNKIPGKSIKLLLLQWPGVVRTLHQRQFRCCSGLILITFKKFLPSNNLLA